MNDYVATKLDEITNELNRLQLTYDTKLLTIALADRTSRLLSILISGGIMPKEEAEQIMDFVRANMYEKVEPTIVKIADGEIVPSRLN